MLASAVRIFCRRGCACFLISDYTLNVFDLRTNNTIICRRHDELCDTEVSLSWNLVKLTRHVKPIRSMQSLNRLHPRMDRPIRPFANLPVLIVLILLIHQHKGQ
jgi:hypothetical protein